MSANTTAKRLRFSVALGLVGLLAGCNSESTVGMVLNPANTATISIEGSNPMVFVNNDGPGSVMVLFVPHGMLTELATPLIRGSMARTMRDGGEVRITNESEERAVVQIRMQRHSGATVNRPKNE